MTDENTTDLTSTEAVTLEEPAAPPPASPEENEDTALRAAYERAMKGRDPEPEPAQAGEQAEEPKEPVVEEVALPPGLPAALKQVWGKLDDEARQVIQKSQNELSGKLANQGRLVQQIAPIRDVLVEAAREIPELANMSPAQVASEVMELAKINARFKADPVGTLVQYADRHQLRDKLAQALGTQAAPQNNIPVKLAEMEQMLARLADPEYLHEQISTVTAQARLSEEVTAFASSADHWDKVQDSLPSIIPGVQAALGDDASPKDVLAKAYEIAVATFVPAAPPPASPTAQPDRAQAAIAAKAVNLPGRQPNGKVHLNEDDAMLDAYHRAMKK